jgi:methylenetetrahydrofolate dehydrogenase (NADP+)/methenyltetrahydrofolate cyclohydrolase
MNIDGKQISAQVRGEVAARVKKLEASTGRTPGLTVVRVGDDPASAIYVRNKQKACEEVGIRSVVQHLPANTTQEELLRVVRALNQDPQVDAILVQLPIPKHLDEGQVLLALDPRKDADGLHPSNVGALASGKPAPRACTPAGVIRMLDSIQCNLAGKRALVVGRSILVGKPAALMLMERNATVTIAHSRTQDLAAEVGRAEVLVAAIGKPELIKGSWIREGAVVIDVGMNRMPDGKLLGDVEFGPASQRASAITPVPGGVGPMTVAMLLVNTVAAAEASAAGAPR